MAYKSNLDSIILSPIGGGVDDWPEVMEQVLAYSNKKKIILGQGTFVCNTPNIQLPKATWLEMSPGTIINCTIPNDTNGGYGSGYPLTSDYFGSAVQVHPDNVLSSTAVVGSKVVPLVSVSGLNIGDSVVVRSSITNSGMTEAFRIEDIQTLNVHFDKPVMMPFPSGSLVRRMVHDIVEDILIDGRGAIMTGTASAAVEIFLGRNIKIKNLRVKGDWSLWALNFDFGCQNVHFENCHTEHGGDAVSGGQWGIGMETARNSSIKGCSAQGTFTSAGFNIDSGLGLTMQNNLATNGIRGFQFVSIVDNEGYSGQNALIEQCYALTQSECGFKIVDGGSDFSFVECRAEGTIVGLETAVQTSAFYPKNVHIFGGKFVGSTAGFRINGGENITIHGADTSGSGIGLFLNNVGAVVGLKTFGLKANNCNAGIAVSQANATGLEFYGTEARNCQNQAILLNACKDFKILGGDLRDSGLVDGASPIYVFGGNPIGVIDGVDVGYTVDPGAIVSYGIRIDTGANIKIRNLRHSMPDPGGTRIGIFVNHASALVDYDGYRMIDAGGAGSGGHRYGIWTQVAGCTLLRGPKNDVSICETPYNFAAAPLKNFGEFTANGVTEVNVTNAIFPSPDSCVSFALKTAAGTVGKTPFISSVLAAGTFKTKADALDTSVYNWTAL